MLKHLSDQQKQNNQQRKCWEWPVTQRCLLVYFQKTGMLRKYVHALQPCGCIWLEIVWNLFTLGTILYPYHRFADTGVSNVWAYPFLADEGHLVKAYCYSAHIFQSLKQEGDHCNLIIDWAQPTRFALSRYINIFNGVHFKKLLVKQRRWFPLYSS